MRTQSLPAAIGRTVTWAGLAAGCGGAGSFAALALIHKHSAPAIPAGAVTAAAAVNAAASAVKTLTGVINAISSLLTALIRAGRREGNRHRRRVRADLARAGIAPRKTPQAAEMQRILAVNPDLPKDRRPVDETLINSTQPPAPSPANLAPPSTVPATVRRTQERRQQGRPHPLRPVTLQQRAAEE
jgi:hypothetical protein